MKILSQGSKGGPRGLGETKESVNHSNGNACMHMASSAQPVCLLANAFNAFIFKVIDMCGPITIFLIALCLFCVGLFLCLCFLLREVPLACCKAGSVVLNSLNF